MTNQWDYSQVTQLTSHLRCIVLHPVDRVKTWKHFFIIALQSPWRHCSCNCAALLDGGLVGRPEFLTDVCGISIRQKKYFNFRHTGNLKNWAKTGNTDIFFLTDKNGENLFHHMSKTTENITPWYSLNDVSQCIIQVYATRSVYGFRY